jgi:hypothetical protein
MTKVTITLDTSAFVGQLAALECVTESLPEFTDRVIGIVEGHPELLVDIVRHPMSRAGRKEQLEILLKPSDLLLELVARLQALADAMADFESA